MKKMANLADIANQTIDNAAEDLNKLSQEIWKRPELNFAEFFAHDLLTDWLEKNGFNVDRQYKGVRTAFRGTFGPVNGKPHVVVLCEYDALPEIGHGCGHNLIAEVGVAAGLGIKAAMEAVGNNIGLLTVLGSPAEEGGGGKVVLINRGALEGVDFAIMSHPSGYDVKEYKTLAILQVYITYFGKASHASGFPWEGVNALDAAVLCYQNLSCLRQQIKPDWKMHGVIINGGAKPNIIPEKAKLEYYLRAPTAAELLQLVQKATACFEAAAKATGCTVKVEFQNYPFLDMVHNATLVNQYVKHAEKLGVDLFKGKRLSSGSTDMGNISYVVPGIHPLFGIQEGVANHTRDFTIAAGDSASQKRTLTEAKILAGVALDVMQDSDMQMAVKSDFKKDMAQRDINAAKELMEKCSAPKPQN